MTTSEPAREGASSSGEQQGAVIRNFAVDVAINTLRNRQEVAELYRELIIQEQQGATVPWRKLNQAIVERYSVSGLRYIKDFAWRTQS